MLIFAAAALALVPKSAGVVSSKSPLSVAVGANV